MDKKLGPLKTWQWIAIGAAVGVVYYLYQVRKHAVGGQGPQPVTTDLGPIDPTTGQPYALEGAYQQGAGSAANGGNNQAQNAGPTNLQQELSDLGQIEMLISGLSGLPLPTQPQTPAQIPSLTPGAKPPATAHITTHKGGPFYTYYQRVTGHAPPSTVPVTNTVYKMWQAGVKAVSAVAPPKANPGHTITTHPNGKHTASSTAPHNARQHQNVAPPAHQRAHPTQHPSTPSGHVAPTPTRPAPRPNKPKVKTGPKRGRG